MPIDELARRTGMTGRNIRAHQSRGLVPPPSVRGRTGYYGDEHLERIDLIKELQADGFNLEAIRRLLEGAGGSSSEVLDFSRALRRPFEDEEPEILDEAEMEKRWGGADPSLLARAEKLGMMRPLGDGRRDTAGAARAGVRQEAVVAPGREAPTLVGHPRFQSALASPQGGAVKPRLEARLSIGVTKSVPSSLAST